MCVTLNKSRHPNFFHKPCFIEDIAYKFLQIKICELNKFELEKALHGMFAAGGALVLTQEKTKKFFRVIKIKSTSILSDFLTFFNTQIKKKASGGVLECKRNVFVDFQK